jgi:hypothetical protein
MGRADRRRSPLADATNPHRARRPARRATSKEWTTMIRIISKKTAGKPATKTAKPAAAKSANKTSRRPKAEAPEVRKPDPDMPDALNRLDPKVEANAAKARDEHAEELRRQHAAGVQKARADAEKVMADATTTGHAGTAIRPLLADKKAKGKAAKPAAGSRKGPNIGSVAREAILAGASNEDALKAVMKAFPDCSSNLGCMAWYRNKLRRDGLLPKAERGKKAA